MLIKTFAWHSLTYVVGIVSTMAVHQVSPGSPAKLQSPTTAAVEETIDQIANRSAKSDRLPIKERELRADGNGSSRLSRQNAPNLTLQSDCKPPIDVVGRCFANATVNWHFA